MGALHKKRIFVLLIIDYYFTDKETTTMSYNLLAGKKGIIFGALNEQSIAWRVAERAVEEGAEIILTTPL